MLASNPRAAVDAEAVEDSKADILGHFIHDQSPYYNIVAALVDMEVRMSGVQKLCPDRRCVD